jgi:RNA-directed DNA polymerase
MLELLNRQGQLRILGSRVNFVRYADDFIITGKSKRLLEAIQPAVEAFLEERGLTLSEEKTLITHIKHGFTFLGQTFRKQANVLHITPAEEGISALISKVGTLIREHVSVPMPALIKALNQTLRGWGNYHRHVVASEAFLRVDTYVREQLWRMLRRRHPNRSKKWLAQKYWTYDGKRLIFQCYAKTRQGLKRNTRSSVWARSASADTGKSGLRPIPTHEKTPAISGGVGMTRKVAFFPV